MSQFKHYCLFVCLVCLLLAISINKSNAIESDSHFNSIEDGSFDESRIENGDLIRFLKRALPRMGRRSYSPSISDDESGSSEYETSDGIDGLDDQTPIFFLKRSLGHHERKVSRALPRMGRALPRMGRALPRMGRAVAPRALPRMG